MTIAHDQHAELQRRLTDAIDQQDWTRVKRLTGPSLKVHIGGQDMNWDGWLAQGSAFYAGFPDGKHDIQETVAEGDRVAMRGVWRGTHRGAFMGIPASGKRVAVDMVIMDRFVDGLLVERWGVFDALALMQQIGALPSG